MNRQGICSGWEGCSCGVQGECVFCYFCKLLRGGLAAEWGGKWEKDTSTHGEGCGRGQGRARVEGRGRGEGSEVGRATSRGLVGNVDIIISKAGWAFFHDESCVFSQWADCPLTLEGIAYSLAEQCHIRVDGSGLKMGMMRGKSLNNVSVL